METKIIYLVYKTNPWHNYSSRELVYIGEDMEGIIAQLIAHRGMTEDDADEIRSNLHNRDYEWEFETQHLNAFTD